MTVDTGSNITIVRIHVLQCPGERVDTQPVEGQLRTVTGETAPIQGRCSVPLTLGSYQTTHETLVADIVDECILGLDYLQQHSCQVDLGEGILHVAGEEVPLHRPQIPRPVCQQCNAKNSVTIPSLSETIVPGQVHGDLSSCRWVLLEPGTISLSHTGVLVGKTLLDMQRDEVPVRLMNLTQHQQISKGTPLAACEPVLSVQ